MVDSKTLNISIGAIIKDPGMFRLASDHLNTKMMCKHAVKKLPFVIKYLPDRYMPQRMCDKVILENFGLLMFVPDWYKD